jgi:SAM-dependent methyltransferase
VIGDQAEAMVRAAAERVQELGLTNVEVRRIDAEWIDLPVGGLDAIVCRWGLMLMADPDAALRECRRVLRPGGKIALAVWAAPERNPWASAPGAVLVKRGLMPMPASQAEGFTPGMFALADEAALHERLSEAGFTEIELQPLPFSRRQASFEEFWETTLDISPGFHGAVMSRPISEIEQIRAEVASSLEPFTAPDGTVEVPATSLVVSASA